MGAHSARRAATRICVFSFHRGLLFYDVRHLCLLNLFVRLCSHALSTFDSIESPDRPITGTTLLREVQRTMRPTVLPYLFCQQPDHSDDLVQRSAAHSATYSASLPPSTSSRITATTLLREMHWWHEVGCQQSSGHQKGSSVWWF